MNALWLFLLVTGGENIYDLNRKPDNKINKDVALVLSVIAILVLAVPVAIGLLHRCFA